MPTKHSLDHLKHLHREAIQFFAAQLSIIKAVLPKITDDRLAKTSTLLMSSSNTGAALLILAEQTDSFTSETVMLARSFMEKLTNFCYASICDEQEYRAFILHPIYKQYHNARTPILGDDPTLWKENYEVINQKQEGLKKIAIVKEALSIFSETNGNKPWTKKTMIQRIDAIEKWGKLFDSFFVISKYEYYADASEALHGSLYGCTLNIGSFEPGFNPLDKEALEKRNLKNTTSMLLHLGLLLNECFKLVSYTTDIEDIFDHSYRNFVNALNLLFHVMEKDIKSNTAN
jgi:hypothetical protein